MTTCNRCNQLGLYWAENEQGQHRLRESGSLGTAWHVCPPITNIAGVTQHAPPTAPTASIADEFKQHAQAAVMDAMAQVNESFTRTMEDTAELSRARMSNAVETARNGIGVDVEIALAQAKEEFRLLMPQRHDLYIHAPDSEVVIEGRPHFQLQRMVNWLNLREHVWAAGPAGSGKTTAAGQAADALGLPHYILPCGMSTNDWSLLGFTNPDGKYIPGHMRQPFEHGGVFVLDEIDNTNPSVLTTINGALSGQSYQFPDANVPRHPDFVVVGCANTWGTGPDRMYVGRNQLDAATLDRFRHVEWGYDEEAEFDWAGRDQSSWVGYVQELRAMARDMRVVISPRASISGAKGIRNGLNWDEVAEDCIFNGMSEDDAARLRANYASR